MEILILIPSFFVFVYTLYSLVKDDYVCIRRSISPENVFDIAFIIFFFSLILGAFVQFSFPILFAVGVFLLYLFVKNRKYPVGRIFDFFTYSFLVSLPVGFVFSLFFYQDQLIFLLIHAAFYLITSIVFMKFLKKDLMSKKIREGTSTIIFILIFSLEFFIVRFFQNGISINSFFAKDNLFWMSILSFGMVLLVFHWIVMSKPDRR